MATKKQGGSNPSEMDERDFSKAPYDSGDPIQPSLQEASVEDLKRGYQEGG